MQVGDLMERVIVSVTCQGSEGQAGWHDVEVAADVAVRQLVPVVARVLGWDPDLRYEVVATSPERRLDPEESLAQAAAWDGTQLIFRTMPSSAIVPPAEQGPIVLWKPLNTPLAETEPTGDTLAPDEPGAEPRPRGLDDET